MLEVSEIGDATIVHVRDEIDANSVVRVERLIRRIEVARSSRVLLSLEHCRHVDSTGLAMVLRVVERIGNRLGVVVPAGSTASRLFEITGLAKASFVFGSLEAALAA